MTIETRPLRVVLVWRGEPLEERVFTQPQQITIGSSKGCTFVVPPSRLGESYPLFRPSADAVGYVLTLAPGMIGKLQLGQDAWAVSEFLDEGRGVRDGEWRQQPLGSADWGIVGLDDSGDVAFFFQFVGEGTPVGPNRTWLDRFLGQALMFSAVVHIALLVLAFVLWEKEDQLDVNPPPSTAIAKILLEQPPEPPPPEEKKPKQDPRKVREEDASKRAAGKEGTIGNPDAKNVKTVIAKGPRDQIVKKVSSLGILGMAKAPNQSQALKSLLSDTPDATMTTALAGVKGATTVIGRGTGGSSTRGDGPGGGGTGNGQLYGVGDIAIGGGGHGSHPNGNGPGHVSKELKVQVTTGTPDTGGGLSKEQILKVVQSHAAAIQFCYEKELQRFPHLAGKVVLGWKVDLDGHVQTTRVDSSSLGNPSAESCMVRQVKNWLFPKPNGIVCNVSFPFFFKGQ